MSELESQRASFASLSRSRTELDVEIGAAADAAASTHSGGVFAGYDGSCDIDNVLGSLRRLFLDLQVRAVADAASLHRAPRPVGMSFLSVFSYRQF
jgi:hypothetical protein